MDRTYDIFERFADGTMLWKSSVVGHDAAVLKLKAMAQQGPNEFRLMHIATNTVIATLKSRPRLKPE